MINTSLFCLLQAYWKIPILKQMFLKNFSLQKLQDWYNEQPYTLHPESIANIYTLSFFLIPFLSFLFFFLSFFIHI